MNVSGTDAPTINDDSEDSSNPGIAFPVDDEIRSIVAEWVRYLRENKLWGNDDPLFPATDVALDTNRQFQVAGLRRAHWTTATPIRGIFRKAFDNAGLPYFNPHSFRNTLAQLGQRICKSPEELKAWSQNIGHENVLTTLLNYGEVSFQRQEEIMASGGNCSERRLTRGSVLLVFILSDTRTVHGWTGWGLRLPCSKS